MPKRVATVGIRLLGPDYDFVEFDAVEVDRRNQEAVNSLKDTLPEVEVLLNSSLPSDYFIELIT